MNKRRASFTTGKTTILKNFTVRESVNIREHVWVDLKETFLLTAAHGADFNWDYDVKTGKRDEKDGMVHKQQRV